MLKNKKFIVLMLCVLILAQTSTAFAVSFTDVRRDNKSGWAYDYIMELAEEGIIQGYKDGTYKPENFVTFVETLQLLNGVMNPTEAEKNSALEKHAETIKSVETPVWAEKTMAVALEREIVSLSELKQLSKDNMIKDNVNKYIPRYTVSQLTARALQLKAKPTGNLIYKDLKDIPKEGLGHIAALIETGVLHKEGRDGEFLPLANIKRSEMAKMIKYAYDWVEDNPLEENFAELTETGVVVSHAQNTSINNLVYKVESEPEATAVAINSNTKIVDKDNKTVKLEDIPKFVTANVTVVYNLVNDEKVATSIKFTTDGQPTDGEYTFLSTKTDNDKNYITVEDKNGNERELEIKNNYVTNGNVNLLLEDVKADQVLNLKISKNIVTEASLKTPQTGEYQVREIDTIKREIQVSPVVGGNYINLRLTNDADIFIGNEEVNFSSIQIGDTIDVGEAYQNQPTLINRVILYSNRNVTQGSYTIQNINLGSSEITLKDNKSSSPRPYMGTVDSKTRYIGISNLGQLRTNDQVEVKFSPINETVITEIRLSSYKVEDDLVYFTKTSSGLELINISDDKKSAPSPNVKLFEGVNEIELKNLPKDGYATVKYDSLGVVIELHYLPTQSAPIGFTPPIK